ncbi:hypothetical protein BMS3Bbin04_01734 [bacterium BMS3Bbin04]|nr:hypothetical protein BMS3Bbin04_01734 [bacterium BMS3Bbin04]
MIHERIHGKRDVVDRTKDKTTQEGHEGFVVQAAHVIIDKASEVDIVSNCLTRSNHQGCRREELKCNEVNWRLIVEHVHDVRDDVNLCPFCIFEHTELKAEAS